MASGQCPKALLRPPHDLLPMTNAAFVSIDQNSHSLWDTLPKLAALDRHQWSGVHYVEDVDVAFTRRGAAVGDNSLALVRERVYRGGAMDWGAALFYTDFLGKLPLDLQQLEPYTGWSSAALARRLGRTVDELYDEYSPSDNWQLVGSSYAGDQRYHRVIGDLGVRETAPFVRELLVRARHNLDFTFPEPHSRARIAVWFDRENSLTEELMRRHQAEPLAELYRHWLRAHLPPGSRVAVTSDLFGLSPENAAHQFLGLVLDHYAQVAELYNQSITETGVGLNHLDTNKGELPFFVIMRRNGHLVRTVATLDGSRIVAGDASWDLRKTGARLPLGQMRSDGVLALVGKAILLVVQVRLKPGGGALALPHHGSPYMPAAHAFESKMRASGMLPWDVLPVYRIRFRFIEHWRSCTTTIRLPEYLCEAFGTAELPADRLAEALPDVVAKARAALDAAQTTSGRERLLETAHPEAYERRRTLEQRRRELARTPQGRREASGLWKQVKVLDRELLQRYVDTIVRHVRVAELDYYDSRGALLPWAVALGGEAFYGSLLDGAEINPEHPPG